MSGAVMQAYDHGNGGGHGHVGGGYSNAYHHGHSPKSTSGSGSGSHISRNNSTSTSTSSNISLHRMSIGMVLNDTDDDAPTNRGSRALPVPHPERQYGGAHYIAPEHHGAAAATGLSPAVGRVGNPCPTPPALEPLPQIITPPPAPHGHVSRAPRYRYSEEEFHFLWYHKNDLGLTWDSIEEKYKLYFGQARSKGGLQCKLYRILEEHGIPKLRDLNRGAHRRGGGGGSSSSSGGVGGSSGNAPRVNYMDHVSTRYEWMLPEHGGGARGRRKERGGRL